MVIIRKLKDRWLNASLSKIFLAVLLAVHIVVVLAAMIVFYWRAQRIGDRHIERFALSQSLLEKNHILSVVERELVLSRKLADSPIVVQWVLNQEDIGIKQAAIKHLESYKKFFKSNSYFIAVASNGHYYLDTIKSYSTNLERGNPLDQWFYDTLEQGKPYSLNVNYDKFLNEVRVWINVLIQDNAGKAIGLTGTGMDLTGFLEKLTKSSQPGVSSIIINSSGELEAHQDHSLIDYNARVDDAKKVTIYDLISNPNDRQSLRSALEKITDDKVQILNLEMEEGRFVVALRYIEQLGWYNLVLIDGGKILGFSDFMPLGLVFIVSLFIVLGSVVFLLNRLVLKPLGSLTEAAATVAGGAYEITLSEIYGNEIGRLSASFNTMTKKIRSYTQNLENMVEQRTHALVAANKELNEYQKRMTDSIEYAKLIQNSIIPAENELRRHFSDCFVILQPVDIVGGDFYFFRKERDYIWVAAVDCTGHGVPGAFMTMMANALLNNIVETYPKAGTGEVLKMLHSQLQRSLRAESAVRHLENGLDIALCRINPLKKEITFSGAGLPLFIYENGEVKHISGDRLHLGFNSRKELIFTEHTLEITATRKYYLITDGTMDYPCEPKGYGIGSNGFSKIIADYGKLSLTAQHSRIIETLESNRGEFSCKDDMLIMGFSIKVRNA